MSALSANKTFLIVLHKEKHVDLFKIGRLPSMKQTGFMQVNRYTTTVPLPVERLTRLHVFAKDQR